MGKRIKDLTSLSLPINDNDKIIIERSDKSYNANISDILSTKQDTISDLDTIRSGAALGATALQAVPSEYVTETELSAKKYLTAIPSEYVTESELSAKKYLTAIPDEYVTETELANKKFAKASELDALEAAVGTGFTSTNTVASAIAAKQTAIDTEVTNRTKAVSDAKSDLIGKATGDYNTLGKLEGKIKDADAAAKAAATKIAAKTTGHVTVSSSKDKTTSALTYTISETDIASAQELAAETTARTAADNTIIGRLDVIQGSNAGSINKAVADAKSELLGDAATDYNTLGKLEDKIITVSGNVTTIQNSVGENTSSKTLSERVNILENKCDKINSKANVLWVGTSIPAGNIVDGVANNYPQMVADALGFNLYNNSIGASFVTYYPNNGIVNDESYNWQKKADIKEYVGYCLSATKQDVENKFRPILERIKANDSTMTDDDIEHYIGVWKWASYEDRIIPYIDGTIASCDTVIIDHGYNDRDNIVAVAGNHADATLDYSSTKGTGGTGDKYPDPNDCRGWYFINHFGDRDYFQGELYMNGCYQHAVDGTSGMKHEYMGALTHIIMAIKKVNPSINVIIGNYFAQRNPIQDYKSPYITKANEGVAKWMSLQCVNVYQYTGLIHKSYTDKNGIKETDFNRFCPDGVHPHSDSTGRSNRIIAGVYINQLRGIV